MVDDDFLKNLHHVLLEVTLQNMATALKLIHP